MTRAVLNQGKSWRVVLESHLEEGDGLEPRRTSGRVPCWLFVCFLKKIVWFWSHEPDAVSCEHASRAKRHAL